MAHQKRAVLVDAFSSGTKLPERFRAYRYELIHVQSRPIIPAYDRIGFDPNAYSKCIVFDDDLEALIKRLRALSPEFVFAGGEYGVALADQINKCLGLPGNDASLSMCRRDKLLMAQRLNEVGVPASLSFDVRTEAEALEAAKRIGCWPVVLKPRDSSSSEGVHFCNNAKELCHAFRLEIGRRNDMYTLNSSLLIMEYLSGVQYTVQTTSTEGRHYISEIWLDKRSSVPGYGVIYDIERLLPRQGDIQDAISDYAQRVLDALGVWHGPGYLEIMMTERGPILIEATSRPMGCQDHDAVHQVKGSDALTLCIASYADPQRFDEMTREPYVLSSNLAVVSSINRVAGVVQSQEWERQVLELESFHSFLRKPAIGDHVSPTINLLTNASVIYLKADDWSSIEVDYFKIRALDAQPGGLFQIDVGTKSATH